MRLPNPAELKLIDLVNEIFELPPDGVFYNFGAEFEDPRQFGECNFVDKNTLIVVNVRAGLSPYKKIFALCHELVHVVQVLEGRLKMNSAALFLFDKEKVNTEEVAYRDLPWEIEAFEQTPHFLKHLTANLDRSEYAEVMADYDRIMGK